MPESIAYQRWLDGVKRILRDTYGQDIDDLPDVISLPDLWEDDFSAKQAARHLYQTALLS